MTARIRCTASIVASVPVLANRHSGSPNLRVSSSATTIAVQVGWAKWVPSEAWVRIASTIAGWPCPASDTP